MFPRARYRGPYAAPTRRFRMPRVNMATAIFGILLIAGGVFVLGKPYLELRIRSNADASALNSWNNGGSKNIAGAVSASPGAGAASPGAATPSAAPACTPGAADSSYALVTFPSLQQYGYAGVSGDGDWSVLLQRSMVHWSGSAAPGQQGNVIIAFHREPAYEHIDELVVGGNVAVQDRACHVWTYQVTGRWDLAPDRVTQLVSTTGHDLTLITCTPFWQDFNRLVWRASLISEDGRPV